MTMKIKWIYKQQEQIKTEIYTNSD